MYLGYSTGGQGTYNQSGGTTTVVAGSLYLGYSSSSKGTYNLSGTGQLSAVGEYVGYGPGATGLFQQSGGTNAATNLTIGSGGTYRLSGGTLAVGGSFVNNGTFDGANSPAALTANCLVDLTSGTWENLSDLSVSMGANSLLIVPAGFNPSTGFGSYASAGITHTAGTVLTVAAGQGFGGVGAIADPVVCQGTIAASSGGAIQLNNGLDLSGAGRVSLGNGSLTVNDTTSGMSGGSLTMYNQYVGSGGTGSFAHTGGTNNLSTLYLGNNSADRGTYTLGGTGALYAGSEVIGVSGTGTLAQTGGTNGSDNEWWLTLGANAGSTGTYNLSGGTLLANQPLWDYLGYSGTGIFNQSGGTCTLYSCTLYMGYNSTARGTYNLSGGQMLAPNQIVGYLGSGAFVQSGGSNTAPSLTLGFQSGGSGTYTLSNTGQLSAGSENVGLNATGVFNQSGGTNTVSTALYLGCNSGGNGTYNLSGTGQLIAPAEYIGENSAATGSFQQTGGTNSVASLTIGSTGQYILSGGTLQISGGVFNQGIFNGDNSPATLSASGIVDLTQGTWRNLADTSVVMGANSLLIVPPGFNPAVDFGSYSSAGITHTAGTVLTVPAGRGFAGQGSIVDPINCQGTITASGGALNLNNGLTLSGSGNVNLGSNGNLTVNDSLSGMSGGSLVANNQYVGNGGTGSFTHSAGTNTLASNLYLGYNPADRGSYNLSGTGVLSVFDGQSDGVCPPTSEYVGYSGTGLFTQSGGSNSTYCWYSTSGLYLGYNSGSTGIYTLSGGTLSVTCGYEAAEFVGYSGTGTFLQTGGTNNVASTQNLGGSLYLGWNSGSSGTYNLSGTGTLKASYLQVGGAGRGVFLQSGGTTNVGGIDVGRSGTGTVAQSAGTITTGEVTVGVSGTGVVSQSGGVTTISNYLTLGYNPGSNGTYLLTGAGRLSAPTETIGGDPAATARFGQSGGTNTTNYLAIGSGGCYQLSGGTLAVGNVGLVNQGLFEGGPGMLTANCLVDLTAGAGGTSPACRSTWGRTRC